MTPNEYYNSAQLTYKSFEHMSIDLKNEVIAEIESRTKEILETIENTTKVDELLQVRTDYIITELSKTRPEEIVIIGLLIVAIGIGAAVLINQKKIKKQLRQLLDQKEDKDVS